MESSSVELIVQFFSTFNCRSSDFAQMYRHSKCKCALLELFIYVDAVLDGALPV
jgi:hypothetical protein